MVVKNGLTSMRDQYPRSPRQTIRMVKTRSSSVDALSVKGRRKSSFTARGPLWVYSCGAAKHVDKLAPCHGSQAPRGGIVQTKTPVRKELGNDLGYLCIALNKGLSGAVLPKRCKRHYKPRRLPRNFVPLGNWPLASATDTPLARRSTLPLALVASPEYSAQEIMAAGEKYA